MVAAVGPVPFNANTISAPGLDAFAITPSDTTNFSSMFRAIYVGAGGNIVVVTPAGSVITFIGAQTGAVLPVCGVRVNAASTTATSLVGLV